MRIVHVFFSFEPAGSELMMWDVLKGIGAMPGFDVHLVVINNRHRMQSFPPCFGKVQVHLLERPEGSRNPLWILRYNRLLCGLNPDIVHFHNRETPALTVKRKGVLFLQTLHTTSLALKGYDRIDCFISISRAVDEDFRNRYGKLKSVVIPNGVDTRKIDYRRNSENNTDVFRIVQVGRISPEIKGQDILIRALAELDLKHRKLVKVDFIGEGDSDNLKRFAAELGVDRMICFKGGKSRAEVYSIIGEYNLMVHPSRVEGFGLAIVEAMVAGVPVAVSSLDAPMDIIGCGKYGDYFETGNYVALARMIEQIIDAYPSGKTRAMGVARDYAVERFSIERTIDSYIDVYRKEKNAALKEM